MTWIVGSACVIWHLSLMNIFRTMREKSRLSVFQASVALGDMKLGSFQVADYLDWDSQTQTDLF